MVYSIDFRWRIVSLIHIYNLDLTFLSDLFGPKPRSIPQWYLLFSTRGVVEATHATARSARWPNDVLNSVERYCKEHPTFYLEELKNFLEATYPSLPNVSLSTICRALNFDLQLSRKVLTKSARDAIPAEIWVPFVSRDGIGCGNEKMYRNIWGYERRIFLLWIWRKRSQGDYIWFVVWERRKWYIV